jgi:hypothetical protein
MLHTLTMQLAELAGKAKPGLLILYDRSNLGGVLEEVPNPEEAFFGRNPKWAQRQGRGRPQPRAFFPCT